MKKLLYILFAVTLLASCSSSDDDNGTDPSPTPTPVNTLVNTKWEGIDNGETQLKGEECTIYLEFQEKKCLVNRRDQQSQYRSLVTTYKIVESKLYVDEQGKELQFDITADKLISPTATLSRLK